MKKVILLILTLFLTPTPSFSNTKPLSLDEIMEVLKHVESNNDPMAVGDGGGSYGILQIRAACVEDVNRHYGTYYSHEDMFQVECAEGVFKLYARMGIDRYVKRHGVRPSNEIIVRWHNGGIYQGHLISATEEYYRKYKLWKKLIELKP
jgi:hypothetical protein